MKTFILFTPNFLEWSLAISHSLKTNAPEMELCGLATGPKSLAERVIATQDIDPSALHRLDDLERRWIDTAPRAGARAGYETALGDDIFDRLTIADRHLGRGFISGGVTPESELAKLVDGGERLERYLLGLLDYCFDTLRHWQPDLVFCHTVDDAPSLALAVVAQHLGITFAQLRHTRIGNRVIIDTSPFDRLQPVRDLFERTLANDALLRSATRPAASYLAALRDAGTTPCYLSYHSRRVQEGLRPSRILRMVMQDLRTAARELRRRGRRELRQVAPLTACLHELGVALRTAWLLRRSPFRPTDWRPKRPFAFYPLHVDPESSTMVQSPRHTDQLAIIESIAKSLPEGMPLLVKEHIPMLGRRPAGFYERLNGLPGVSLCSPFVEGLKLAQEAALTTVISSTAAWEAIVFGRPTVIIAYPPFAMVNDGFVAEPDLTRLPDAVRRALAMAPATERRLRAYVAAVIESSFACPTEVIWGRVTTETIARNPQILSEIVERLLSLARLSDRALRLTS